MSPDNKEPTPIPREQLEQQMRDLERESERLKARIAELKAGQTPLFTWRSLVLGLVVVAALVLPFISDVHPALALLVGGAAAMGCAWLWRTSWTARRAIRTAERDLQGVERVPKK